MRCYRMKVETLTTDDFAFTVGDYAESLGLDRQQAASGKMSDGTPITPDTPMPDMPDSAADRICNIWNRENNQYKYWWER